MEKDINIAAILKDKSDDVKLYDSIRCISVNYKWLGSKSGSIHCVTGNHEVVYEKNGSLLGYPKDMQILKPSKVMQDWSKFAWKKGDVLSCGSDYCIFKEWIDDSYTLFKGLFVSPMLKEFTEKTSDWEKETNKENIALYIYEIEEYFGGKFNMETLEIEKQPQFKDGDVLTIYEDKGGTEKYKKIVIFKDFTKFPSDRLYINAYAEYDVDENLVETKKVEINVEVRKYRLATDSEKQQLFDALEKEGKRWNSETKTLEDLPKKCDLQPFDKVLVRDTKDERWRPAFFAYMDDTNDYAYGLVGDLEDVFCNYCIPYNEQTKHLLGTTNDWERRREKMTVKELIGYLQNFDGNKEVLVHDGNTLIPPLSVSIGGDPKSNGYEKVILTAIKL